jgi:hypothetical protein
MPETGSEASRAPTAFGVPRDGRARVGLGPVPDASGR